MTVQGPLPLVLRTVSPLPSTVSTDRTLGKSATRSVQGETSRGLTAGTPSPRCVLGTGILRRACCTWGRLLHQCHTDTLKVRRWHGDSSKRLPAGCFPRPQGEWESVSPGPPGLLSPACVVSVRCWKYVWTSQTETAGLPKSPPASWRWLVAQLQHGCPRQGTIAQELKMI